MVGVGVALDDDVHDAADRGDAERVRDDVEQQRGVRRLDTLAPRHFQSLQATTAGYDWHEACEALLNAIDLYRELRSEVGGGLKTSLAEKAAVNYANTQIDRRLG